MCWLGGQVTHLTAQAVWLYSAGEGTSGTAERHLIGLPPLPEDYWAGVSSLGVKITE